MNAKTFGLSIFLLPVSIDRRPWSLYKLQVTQCTALRSHKGVQPFGYSVVASLLLVDRVKIVLFIHYALLMSLNESETHVQGYDRH